MAIFITKPLLKSLYLLLLLTLPTLTNSAAQSAFKDLKPTIILISIDGFRADYLTQYPHPTLDTLAREGVRARWMIPSYPSLTFPNHYAVVTGLYPSHSGIVANDMYDPVFDAVFTLSKRDEVQNGRWWGGEPIWITAERQGQRASATFWPGSEAEIKGYRPSYWKTYDDKVPPADRVDSVLSLLDLPAERRPTFLTLYFSNVDHAGHDHSPNSDEVAAAIGVVDQAIKRLVDGLRARNIYQRVNLIVVSDHGMAPAPARNLIILDDYFDSSKAKQIAWGGEVVNIFPQPGAEKLLFHSIKRDKLRHAQCYRKQQIPARFHYRANRRIGAIVCTAKEGWRLVSRARFEEDAKQANQSTNVKGAHGYDNKLRSMRAIFIGHGPAFKRAVTVNPFPNVDVYNVMTRILRLSPARNDGDMRAARALLR